MAGSGSHRSWWIATPILLFFVATGVFWPILDGEVSGPATQLEGMSRANVHTDSVRVESWNWKRDRSGSILAVYGILANQSGRDLTGVILRLRTEDDAKNTLSTHTIIVPRLPARSKRPFREDIPRTGKESMGYLDVVNAAP